MAVAISGVPAAQARETLQGPFKAEVERVLDGDTLEVRVRVWLNQELRVLVRVRGIDAPEKKGACPAERAMAGRAAAHLAILTSGGPVALTAVTGGKYFGRVLADVVTANGTDVAAAMLDSGLARPYQGGRRGDWCGSGVATSSIN